MAQGTHGESGSSDAQRWPAVAREGWPIVAGFALVGLLLVAIAQWRFGSVGALPVGLVALALTGWCVWFFRDPERTSPDDPSALVSPADGVVCFVGKAPPPPELGIAPEVAAGLTRLSVFMNVFDVHVNRAPLAGVVTMVRHKQGKFVNASLDKASEANERCSIVIRTDDGMEVPVVQIAGLVARRIVCRVGEGQRLERGGRYGLIRFGSRVDVYLSPGTAPAVQVGDRTVAGETVIARPAGGSRAGAGHEGERLFTPAAGAGAAARAGR